MLNFEFTFLLRFALIVCLFILVLCTLVLFKGGIPAAPSGTATLLRLSPSYWFYPNEIFYLPLQVYPTSMA